MNAKTSSAAATPNRVIDEGVLQDHPIEIKLFNSTGAVTVLWLLVRLWLGYQWVTAGLEKLANPAWMSGAALSGFWKGSVAQFGQPHSQVAYDWYAAFLNSLLNSGAQSWFAPLVAVGETLAGICLILGLFTGLAALVAAFLNFNFMLSGSAGVNPLYFVLGMILLMAWKNAGWIGLDRWVLRALGTPWHPGTLFQRKVAQPTA